ncbi:GNAT family N-acetyltransferase [Enterovibrio norvegicus FF-454]|uniref:GNAT family N-acetyltransferase n=1 Tax=Enterovibrio norvegicus FF-454 TaxID=1185651 RepID=A0A1E5C2Z2_9GAMM|nr:GNAT family N-acetyltransferase [Enterovibrio norvegicus]OEE59879.1 GNAT family N-acetyltransferase [Enterovibrio norvegicus FF-454]
MDNAINLTLIPTGQAPDTLQARFPSLLSLVVPSNDLELPMLVAEKDGVPVAVAVLQHEKRHNGIMVSDATITLLEVDEASRLQGIGKALLNALEAYAATVTHELKVDCGAVIGRKPMQALLAHSGYQPPFACEEAKTTQWKKSLV